MQTREISLNELESAYEAVKELLLMSYDEFEDLIYAMRHQEYKMYGIFDNDLLITYAGISVQTTLTLGRHLYVHELITKPSHMDRDYDLEMLFYLHDLAKLHHCPTMILGPGSHKEERRFMLEREGFTEELTLLKKSL